MPEVITEVKIDPVSREYSKLTVTYMDEFGFKTTRTRVVLHAEEETIMECAKAQWMARSK